MFRQTYKSTSPSQTPASQTLGAGVSLFVSDSGSIAGMSDIGTRRPDGGNTRRPHGDDTRRPQGGEGWIGGQVGEPASEKPGGVPD